MSPIWALSLAAAKTRREERRRSHSSAPDSFEGDRTAAGKAAVPEAGIPAGADDGRTHAYREHGDAGTGRVAAQPENAPPLEVAELDDMSGQRLDLAEFVIQAAVSGDDDGADPAPGPGAPGPGKPLQPGPETARYGSGARESGDGEAARTGFAARRDMHDPDAAPASGTGCFRPQPGRLPHCRPRPEHPARR